MAMQVWLQSCMKFFRKYGMKIKDQKGWMIVKQFCYTRQARRVKKSGMDVRVGFNGKKQSYCSKSS